MVAIIMTTPQELKKIIAERARAKRLELNLSQQTLSEKSGVNYATLKKFEQTGQISLEALLKLALVLGCTNDFYGLFSLKTPEKSLSLDALIENNVRKRGRK